MYFCFSLFSNPVAKHSAVTPPLPGRSITVVVNQRQLLISHVMELTQDDPISCCRVEFSWFFLLFLLMDVDPDTDDDDDDDGLLFLKSPPKKRTFFFLLIYEFATFIHTSVLSTGHE